MPFPPAVLSLLRELSALPYENLSKIVAFHHTGADPRKVERALDLGSDWLSRTLATGAGGTCFSLTWWLARRMREEGFAGDFLMADKGKSRDIHCGLRFAWQGRGYLLDPGYMIFDPLPLPVAGLSATVWSSPNEVRVEDAMAAHGGNPHQGGGAAVGSAASGRVWRLWSGPKGGSKWRFDFRQEPVSESEFLRHWEDSYRLPMMGYPVLNRVREGTQYYLQKRSLLVRTPDASEMRKLSCEEMLEAMGGLFGIPQDLAREALDIVLMADNRFFLK